MQYFDHNVNAATDPKVMQLRLEQGGAAVDAYWYLIEQMHRDERPICVCNASAMRVHCHTLCTDADTLEKWLESMVLIDLLSFDESGENVYSERTMKNIDKYQSKQEKARSAAESRWGNANVKQTHKRTQCKRNADALPTKQNKTNRSNATKGITSSIASDGADAGETAPPPQGKPYCPKCGSKVWKNPQTGRFDCDECRSELKASEVVWS